MHSQSVGLGLRLGLKGFQNGFLSLVYEGFCSGLRIWGLRASGH